jgi:hypothetical protein
MSSNIIPSLLAVVMISIGAWVIAPSRVAMRSQVAQRTKRFEKSPPPKVLLSNNMLLTASPHGRAALLVAKIAEQNQIINRQSAGKAVSRDDLCRPQFWKLQVGMVKNPEGGLTFPNGGNVHARDFNCTSSWTAGRSCFPKTSSGKWRVLTAPAKLGEGS